jgi:hypothetical protein
MTTPRGDIVTPEEFKLMSDRAGLGMSQEELDQLKPLYDLYTLYIQQIHSIDLAAEDMGVTFHPEWPSA